MEGASVSVDSSELGAAFSDLERRGKNTRGVMRQVALILVEEVDEMFETSGHGKWKDFAESTKRARGDMSSAKLLLDTGAMAASITPAYSQTEAEAFTNDPKAKYHVSDKPRKKLPKRDFFDIDLDSVSEEAAGIVLMELTSP